MYLRVERTFELCPMLRSSTEDHRSGPRASRRSSALRTSETPSSCFVLSTSADYRLRRGGASVSVADVSNATDALGAVRQDSEFPPQIADVDIDASVERRIFVVQDLL